MPADLKRGFRVLVVFAFLGVVLPIVIMATQPDTVSPFMRLVVVVSFVLGLGWLVVFIFRLIAAAEGRKPYKQAVSSRVEAAERAAKGE